MFEVLCFKCVVFSLHVNFILPYSLNVYFLLYMLLLSEQSLISKYYLHMIAACYIVTIFNDEPANNNSSSFVKAAIL